MNWLCVVLLVFLLLSVIYGARKGLVRMVVSLVFLLLVIGLASVIHPYISDFLKNNTKIYDTVLESSSTMIMEKMRDQEEEMTLTVQVEFIDSLPIPQGMKDGLLKGNNENAWQLFSVDKFADYVAAYLADLILRAVAFLLSFLAAFVLVKIGLHLADILTSIPGISLVNRLAGALFGLLQGMIWIWLFFVVIMLFRDTEAGRLIMTAVEENEILRGMYNNNILWYLLTRLMFWKLM